jgi:predicted exporter
LAVFSAWLLVTLLLGLLALRTDYRADLSVFLPQKPTNEEKILAEQLQSGAANRILLMALEGAPSEVLAKVGKELARQLRADPAIAYVHNGQYPDLEKENKLLFEHRYLLSAQTQATMFTESGLHAALQNSLAELGGSAGLISKDMLASDPTGQMLQLMDQMLPSGGPAVLHGHWFSPDHRRAMMLVQLALEGTNSNAQEQTLQHLQARFETLKNADPAARGMQLIVSGAPVFALDARNKIRSEVSRLSTISLALIVLLLYWMLRSPRYLLLSLMPLATGVLAGISAVSLWFGNVHGMTIGFGTTLMGEAVDYAIYLFMLRERAQGEPGQGSMSLWQTIRLGLLTSVCGFMALLFSGFNGMAQLGLFSVVGLVVAAAVARWVLPPLLPTQVGLRDMGRVGARLQQAVGRLAKAHKILLVLGGLGLLVLVWRGPYLWNHNLGALSPVSAEMQNLDGQLREQLGAGDVRHMLVLLAPDDERALQACEAFRPHLEGLVKAQLIASYDAPCNIIPSKALQVQRQAVLPEPAALTQALDSALKGLPLDAAYLAPFLASVQASRHLAPLEPKDLAGTALSTAVDVALNSRPDGTTLLIQLRPPTVGPKAHTIDRQAVFAQLQPHLGSHAVLLDIKQASENLYKTYMQKTLWFSAMGLVAILLLLAFSLRSLTQVLQVVLPLLFSMTAVALGLHVLGISLNLLHIVGLLMIFAVGSNYALFFVTTQIGKANSPHQQQTLVALAFANLTTVIGFGILAFSSTPVLQTLGETVGPGAFLALLFSAILCRPSATSTAWPEPGQVTG